MAYYIILYTLIIIGIVGWILFFLTITQLFVSRKKEFDLIVQIKEEIKNVKQDINHLK